MLRHVFAGPVSLSYFVANVLWYSLSVLRILPTGMCFFPAW